MSKINNEEVTLNK